jgi:hypothetical protein
MLRSIAMLCAVIVLANCTPTRPTELAPATHVTTSDMHAQEMLRRLIGRWQLSGAIAGENTVHDVSATWALQHKYVELREVSRERGDYGEPAYEAIIYLGWLHDHYVCFWFDNTDVASTEVRCEASAGAPNVIPLEFRNGQGELIFLNTFEYQPEADTWTWLMESPEGGARETFGRVTLRRH